MNEKCNGPVKFQTLRAHLQNKMCWSQPYFICSLPGSLMRKSLAKPSQELKSVLSTREQAVGEEDDEWSLRHSPSLLVMLLTLSRANLGQHRGDHVVHRAVIPRSRLKEKYESGSAGTVTTNKEHSI